jgi:hypothetical protein
MASKAQTVVEALQTLLETNLADTVYKPDLVQPILFFPDEKAIPVGVETLYLIKVEGQSGRQKQSCDVTERLRVVILGLHRYSSASEDPFKEDPTRLFVATDLSSDIATKLESDPKLGAEALDALDGFQEAEFEFYLPKFVIVGYETSVLFRRLKGDR